MARIRPEPSVIIRGRKRRSRPLEPEIFTRIETFRDGIPRWALYLCIEREGEVRRVELDARVARRWLEQEAARCDEVVAAWRARMDAAGEVEPPEPGPDMLSFLTDSVVPQRKVVTG